MRKWMTGAAALATVFVFLNVTACGAGDSKADFDRSTIQVQKDGKVRATEVDVLDKSVYSFEELKEMAQETVDDYNSKGNGKVTLESVELLDEETDTVRMVLDYESTADYVSFNTPVSNSAVLFFGTVSNAMAAGYSMVDMWEAEPSKTDPELVSRKEIEAMGDKRILITSEKGQVCVPDKIAYIGDNAALTVEENQKQATLVDSASGLFYLLLK